MFDWDQLEQQNTPHLLKFLAERDPELMAALVLAKLDMSLYQGMCNAVESYPGENYMVVARLIQKKFNNKHLRAYVLMKVFNLRHTAAKELEELARTTSGSITWVPHGGWYPAKVAAPVCLPVKSWWKFWK